MNQATALKGAAEIATLPRGLRNWYYPVASALSYNTAVDAGKVFARAGHRRIAKGFGAYMADNNYSDVLEMGRHRIALPASMPNRYVRTVAVARGFWDGYRATAGRPPEAFHFLGLGAPIMVALAALCAWGTPELTFDAMSPIKDAVEGTLYTTKPAYLKLRCRSVAYRLATEAGSTWTCPCPVCHAFMRRHPFRYPAGRTWHTRTKSKEVATADLKQGGALYDAYPLLSEPTAGPLRKEVSEARMGHNHWVLAEIMGALRRHSRTAQQLRTFVRDVTVDYGKATNSARFREAINFAFRLANDDV
jgi:hypothetical protein